MEEPLRSCFNQSETRAKYDFPAASRMANCQIWVYSFYCNDARGLRIGVAP